jgi:hypothetical protein
MRKTNTPTHTHTDTHTHTNARSMRDAWLCLKEWILLKQKLCTVSTSQVSTYSMFNSCDSMEHAHDRAHSTRVVHAIKMRARTRTRAHTHKYKHARTQPPANTHRFLHFAQPPILLISGGKKTEKPVVTLFLSLAFAFFYSAENKLHNTSRLNSEIINNNKTLAKDAALRINLNIDGAPIASRSHTHPSHTQNSRLLTSSLSLGVPVPSVTQCM